MELTVIADKKGGEIVKGWMKKHLPQANITFRKGKSGTVKIICSGLTHFIFDSLRKLLAENNIALSVWIEKKL